MAEAVAAAIFAAATTDAAVSAAIWIASNAAAINTVAVVAANVGFGAYSKRQAQRQQRAAYNASLQDREVMIRSAIAPRRVVLGRDRISGPIVYGESTGTKGEYLHLVLALAHGECDAIEEVWFNDIKLPDPDGSGFITSGEFAKNTVTQHMHVATIAGTTLTLPYVASKVTSVDRDSTWANADGILTTELVTGWAHAAPSATITGLTPGTYTVNYERTTSTPVVRIKKHLGGPGQVADADLVSESAGKWTSAHVGVGVTYLYARLQYDQDVWGQVGIPNITCVVRGGKAYDPRSGLTVWTENTALLAAKWLRDGDLGFDATAAQVPGTELGPEANICDEAVALDAGGTTQKRYVFNGSFTSDDSPRDVLEDILSGMAGTAVWVQGRWLLRAGAYRTPAATLDEDALAGSGVGIVPRASRSELFNAVRVTHRDSSQGWAEVQAPLVENAGYQAEDGGRQIVRDVTLPGEMDTWRAQRLGKIILERARQSTAVRLSTNLRGYDLAPTDTVPLSLARYGFASKVFEVRSRTFDPMSDALQYLLVETAAGVWAWNYGEATVGDLAPNTALPNPYSRPAALGGLAVDAGPSYVLRNRGGLLVPQAYVTWTASTDTFVLNGGRIDVQWKLSSATEWQDTPRVDGNQTSTLLTPMPEGTVVLVRVRAVNAAGRTSEWATVAAGVARTSLPLGVAGGNMLVNPCFLDKKTDGWAVTAIAGLTGSDISTVDFWGGNYNLDVRETGYLHKPGSGGADGDYVDASPAPAGIVASPDRWYQFSVWACQLYCGAQIYCEFLDASGALIGYGGCIASTHSGLAAGTPTTARRQQPAADGFAAYESNYTKLWFTAQAPAGTARIVPVVRMYQAPAAPYSYVFMTRAMLCEVTPYCDVLVPFDFGAGGLQGLPTAGTAQIEEEAATTVVTVTNAGPVSLPNSIPLPDNQETVLSVTVGPYAFDVRVEASATFKARVTAPSTKDNYIQARICDLNTQTVSDPPMHDFARVPANSTNLDGSSSINYEIALAAGDTAVIALGGVNGQLVSPYGSSEMRDALMTVKAIKR